MTPTAEFVPCAGVAEVLEPGVRRILAPNPSPMTYHGTNTYIVGKGRVAIIDPGPADTGHLHRLLAALAPSESVSHILVTHSHVDHSPLARPLSEATGAPVLAFGDSGAGRSAVMRRLADAGLTAGGEGVDPVFCPDVCLVDGQQVHGDSWTLQAIRTPGHFGNHMCFALRDAIFTGDHVMGWASSLISPPDGDLTEFMSSTRKLARRGARVLYPGHGPPVTAPGERLLWLTNHRLEREMAILRHLGSTSRTPRELAAAIYRDVAPGLLLAAERNVFAHLVDLHIKNRVTAAPDLAYDARFFRR